MSEDRRIEMMRLDEVVPALRNPRKHQLVELRASVERFGFTVPPILDERTGRLVAGHGRCQLMRIEMDRGAERPAGIEADADGTWMVPVVRGWESRDDAEAEAYLLADNRLTEIAGWDTEALLKGLEELRDGPGLAGVGYAPEDIDDLFARLQEEAEITHPDLPANHRNAQVKSLVLDYPLDQYGYVAATAHKARQHYGAPSNAELFTAMLREYAEEHPA